MNGFHVILSLPLGELDRNSTGQTPRVVLSPVVVAHLHRELDLKPEIARKFLLILTETFAQSNFSSSGENKNNLWGYMYLNLQPK